MCVAWGMLVCMRVCTFVYVGMRVCMWMCMHVRALGVCKHVVSEKYMCDVCTYMRVYVHVYVPDRVYIYVYMYAHVYVK